MAKRMVMTAARGRLEESCHGIEFRTMGLFQIEMGYAPTFQQVFFIMSSFVGHHCLVGLLELLHQLFDIVYQLDSGARLFSAVGIIK